MPQLDLRWGSSGAPGRCAVNASLSYHEKYRFYLYRFYNKIIMLPSPIIKNIDLTYIASIFKTIMLPSPNQQSTVLSPRKLTTFAIKTFNGLQILF